ncbi:MAG: hypothetical protein A4E60_01880 [Syntrophorhabdus sp. PtaB.Bin047]|jgi:hypothetical protein|nr:MAG: hypothetical protein A4E60_01880 [Syntrophorhabdus sp. PtaB.Bin047]
MKRACFAIAVLLTLCSFLAGCGEKEAPRTVKVYPLDNMEGVLTQSNVTFDPAVSVDKRGSLRVDAPSPTTVRLFEVRDVDVDKARLTYQARLKTRDFQGKVYLEMWCVFTGKGEYFSRALETSVTGTTDWVTQETPFFLKKGQRPDVVRLNLVVDGKGTVWIDDVKLVRGPLK